MANEERENKIRSIGDKNWFWVSKSVLSQYGRILKGSGLGVYSVLASYANSKSQTCFPSQKTIANRIGLSRRTVNRKIRALKHMNLVKVRRIRGRCLYFLLKPDAPNGIQAGDKGDTEDKTPGDTNNNKYKELINKNNGAYDFNSLKPIRRLLKRYDKRG